MLITTLKHRTHHGMKQWARERVGEQSGKLQSHAWCTYTRITIRQIDNRSAAAAAPTKELVSRLPFRKNYATLQKNRKWEFEESSLLEPAIIYHMNGPSNRRDMGNRWNVRKVNSITANYTWNPIYILIFILFCQDISRNNFTFQSTRFLSNTCSNFNFRYVYSREFGSRRRQTSFFQETRSDD